MERLLPFPKYEYLCFLEAKKHFAEKSYHKAIELLEIAIKLKYLQRECIKYLIDCHIELQNFDEVYKMIENEFVDNHVDEEFLLKKYLYTMYLEKQYIEAKELIKIYLNSRELSQDLKRYLQKLLIMIEEKEKNSDEMSRYFLSNEFCDQVQIILNLDKLDVKKYEHDIKYFFNNPDADAFVKYSLLKYLYDNDLLEEVRYRNYFADSFIINRENYHDLLSTSFFINPIINVLKNINQKDLVESFIKNIWLEFYIKYYPNLIEDENLASAILHILILKSINKIYNLEEIAGIYDIEKSKIITYFKM